MNRYVNAKEKRYINATEFAYNAIYKAQGYMPAGDEDEKAADNGDRGDNKDNGACDKSKRRK